MSDDDTINIIAVEPHDERLIQIIEEWTAVGLLRPSLWLGKDPSAAGGEVADLPVRLLREEGCDELPLRTVLGARAYRIVRLVAVRPLAEPVSLGAPGQQLRELAEHLKQMIPMRTRLVRINLLVPGRHPVPAEAFLEPEWEANVVVSPEDRPSEHAIDHGVGRQEIFPAHAALACATVAALWRHVDVGAFDAPDEPAVGNHGRIVVARSSSRVLDGGSLPDQVIGKLLQEGVTTLLPELLDQGATAVPNDQMLAQGAFAAIRTIDDRPFEFHPHQIELPPAQPLLRHTFRSLLRSVGRLVRRRVDEARQRGAEGLGAAVEQWLVNPFDRDLSDLEQLYYRNVPPTPQQLREVAQAAPGLLPKRVAPPRFLWLPLRQVCFGLVDGGQLPDEIRETIGTLTPTVSHPRWVVPSPEDRFQLEPKERDVLAGLGISRRTVRATDMNAAANLDAHLRYAIDTASGADYRPVLGEPGDGPDQARQRDIKVLGRCRDRLKTWSSRERNQSFVVLLTTHVSEQLLAAKQELNDRARDYKRYDDMRTELLERLDRSEESQRSRRWNRWTGLATAVATVLLVVDLIVVPPFFLPLTYVLTSIASLGIGWSLLRLARQAIREAWLEHQLEEVERHRRATVAAVRQWPAEADRLASLYDILADWGEIIGWMLHKPFSDGGAATVTSGADHRTMPQALRIAEGTLATEQLQNLLALIAHHVFHRGWIMQLYVTIKDRLMAQMRAVNPATEELPDPDLSPALDISIVQSDPDPDLPGEAETDPASEPGGSPDTAEGAGGEGTTVGGADPERPSAVSPMDVEPPPPWHARGRLLEHFRSENAGMVGRQIIGGLIRRSLHGYAPEQLLPVVTTGEENPDGMLRTEEAGRYLGDIMPQPDERGLCTPLTNKAYTLDGQVAGKNAVHRIWVWGAKAALSDGSVTVPNHPSVIVTFDTQPEEVSAQPYRVQITRLDVSDHCQVSDVAILASEDE